MAEKSNPKKKAVDEQTAKRTHRSEKERVEQLAEKAAAKVERMEKRYTTMRKQVEDYKAALATARYEADVWNSHPLLTEVPEESNQTDSAASE